MGQGGKALTELQNGEPVKRKQNFSNPTQWLGHTKDGNHQQ